MTTGLVRVVIATAICSVSPMFALAQIGYLWTPQELAAKADIVAIVQVAAARDTGRRQSHPELTPDLPVVEMEADLLVLACLKAPESADAGRSIRLTYFRHDVEQWQRENESPPGVAPRVVVNGGSTLQLERGRSRYLVFLSRRPDGRYEPISGHTFPTTSVLRLCESGQKTC